MTVRGIEEKIGGETMTIDVSGSGIQIIDKWRLPLGLDVRVELQLPGGRAGALARAASCARAPRRTTRGSDWTASAVRTKIA